MVWMTLCWMTLGGGWMTPPVLDEVSRRRRRRWVVVVGVAVGGGGGRASKKIEMLFLTIIEDIIIRDNGLLQARELFQRSGYEGME